MIYYSAVGRETGRRVVAPSPEEVIAKINEYHASPYEIWDIYEERNLL